MGTQCSSYVFFFGLVLISCAVQAAHVGPEFTGAFSLPFWRFGTCRSLKFCAGFQSDFVWLIARLKDDQLSRIFGPLVALLSN